MHKVGEENINKEDTYQKQNENTVSDNQKSQYDEMPNLPDENQSNYPEIIELEDFSPMMSDVEEDDHIKFHRSPRNIEELEFIEKLNKAKQKDSKEQMSAPQSVEDILGRIPKEYFRKETRYESIDAVLDHISK